MNTLVDPAMDIPDEVKTASKAANNEVPSLSKMRKTVTKSRSQKRPLSVSFNNVEIREYERCLGNHPTSTDGPSLTIDWNYEQIGSWRLNEFEHNHKPRRMLHELLLSGRDRVSLLKELTSCSEEDISNNIASVRAIRHQRQMTIAFQEYEPWQLVYECFMRRMRRWRSGTTKKQEQDLVWAKANSSTKSKTFSSDRIDDTLKTDISLSSLSSTGEDIIC